MIKISVSEGKSYIILNHRGLGFLLGFDGRWWQEFDTMQRGREDGI